MRVCVVNGIPIWFSLVVIPLMPVLVGSHASLITLSSFGCWACQYSSHVLLVFIFNESGHSVYVCVVNGIPISVFNCLILKNGVLYTYIKVSIQEFLFISFFFFSLLNTHTLPKSLNHQRYNQGSIFSFFLLFFFHKFNIIHIFSTWNEEI